MSYTEKFKMFLEGKDSMPKVPKVLKQTPPTLSKNATAIAEDYESIKGELPFEILKLRVSELLSTNFKGVSVEGNIKYEVKYYYGTSNQKIEILDIVVDKASDFDTCDDLNLDDAFVLESLKKAVRRHITLTKEINLAILDKVLDKVTRLQKKDKKAEAKDIDNKVIKPEDSSSDKKKVNEVLEAKKPAGATPKGKNERKIDDLLDNPFSKAMDRDKLVKSVAKYTEQRFSILNENTVLVEHMTDFAELSLQSENADVMVPFYIEDAYSDETKTVFMTDFNFGGYKKADNKNFYLLKSQYTSYIEGKPLQPSSEFNKDPGILPIARSPNLKPESVLKMRERFYKMVSFFVEIDNFEGSKEYMPSANFYVIQSRSDDTDIKLVPKGFLHYL